MESNLSCVSGLIGKVTMVSSRNISRDSDLNIENELEKRPGLKINLMLCRYFERNKKHIFSGGCFCPQLHCA